ncbi:hypothetical protein SLEP1_g37797 [Rubroshorea leprosula]|uniref:AB hydrolase-1 domain-containing protein n=1 Tax=Rubroshorea leprosula TaxID=152421 RepID=A0AAV5KWG9_9ROSI|nr:hypothetical protein SLEP1_g37797 [Rubroshorea leprosula]
MDGGRREYRGGYRGGPADGWKDVATEFMRGLVEMSVEFGKGCRDVVRQSLVREDSFLVRNFGKDSYIGSRIMVPFGNVFRRLRLFNEYLLPEDKDPKHAWLVILFVFVLALAVLGISTNQGTPIRVTRNVYIRPPSANRILLPDGRYMAYREQGVPADRARFSIIAPHSFLSSRLAGIPGLKASLLEEFGVRLLTFDLPGFGESDPHPNRNLESSALDMSFLANALGLNGKFWVVGYSSGALHAWAALRYIPHRIAGAAMLRHNLDFDVSLYEVVLLQCFYNSEDYIGMVESRSKNSMKKIGMYYPLMGFINQKNDLSHWWRRQTPEIGGLDPYFGNNSFSLLAVGALIEDPIYEEFWQRDFEESIRQGNAKPFVEEAVLQVSNWGFSIADLKMQKKQRGKGILNMVKLLLRGSQEEYTGFLGPIHIWQGMDDKVVPPSMTDFVHRVLQGAAVHKLPYEGHFTYFYFCDECHRQIFTTIFGTPQGPLNNTIEVEQTPLDDTELQEEVTLGDTPVE